MSVMIKDKQRTVLNSLIKRNIIPCDEIFEISDTMIDEYCSTYHLFYGNPNSKIKNSNIKFNRKMAGITILKLNNERREFLSINAIKKNNIKPKNGLFYIVSNPLFEGYYKVGITIDIDKRLAVYQTGDPLRRYKIEHYIFCQNCRQTEKEVLEKYSVNISTGEWIKDKKALEILRFAEKFS